MPGEPKIADEIERAMKSLSLLSGDELHKATYALGKLAYANSSQIVAALRAQDRAVGAGEDQPSPGLLMSMAIRYDHALGMPGCRDWPVMPGLGEREPGRHARILANTMGTMRQLWEEVTGSGFYSPAREAAYVASAKALGVGFDEINRPVALPLSPARTEDGNA